MPSLGRSSIIFSAMTLISRVLGLLRDILIANFFDSSVTDPFFAALRIPNTLRRFFAEGSFANAFVPVFSGTKAESPETLKSLFSQTLGTLLVILFVVSFAGVIGSSWIIYFIAHGLVDKGEQFFLASQMLKIMFPYILFISVTAMFSGVLNSFGKFALPALVPVFLNIALILACTYVYYFDPKGSGIELAWAVLIGGAVQMSIQLPALYRLNLLSLPKPNWRAEKVQRIFKLMLPTLFGSSIGQLSILINTFLASSLVTGSISWLYYSDRMTELPIALIGVAIATVILPQLSALKTKNNSQEFSNVLGWAVKSSLIIGSAAGTGLFMLAPSILITLFYGGNFNAHDVEMTTLSLRMYSFSVMFLIMIKVLAPAFYARQDTKTPVIAGVVAIFTNILFALILSRFFAHVGLAAASSIASVINVTLLLTFLKKDKLALVGINFLFLLRIVVANLLMAGFIYLINFTNGDWISLLRIERFLYICLFVLLSILIYGASLFILGVRWSKSA